MDKQYINIEKFLDKYKEEFKSLNTTQVFGMEKLFNYWDHQKDLKDLRWLAYIMATVHHETGATWQAVREGFAKTNEGSIRAVTNLYNRGGIRTNYALPKANGHSYYGRGWDQLTWDFNYKKQQEKTKGRVLYYDNPDLALDINNNAERITRAMVDGDYTGRKLSQYFSNVVENWDGARYIVNGKDKAALIGGYGKRFHKCLLASSFGSGKAINGKIVESPGAEKANVLS